MLSRWVSLLFLVAALAVPSSLLSQEPIVLRDLTVIANSKIKDFDRFCVELDDGRKLAWKDILQAKVESSRQSDFDQLLKDVGLPRHRLEVRLRHRDWAGAFRMALVRNSDDDSQLSLLEQFQIFTALARGFMADGVPESAMVPLLRSLELYEQLSPEQQEETVEYRWPRETLELRFDSTLLPVCFDRKKATLAVAELQKAVTQGQVTQSSGAQIYLASLALCSGEIEFAEAILNEAVVPAKLEKWIVLLKIQFQLERGQLEEGQQALAELLKELSGEDRAVALYLKGRYYLKDSAAVSSTEAQLALLKLAALYRDKHSSLVAAGLFRAAEIAEETGDTEDAEILRNELVRSHATTYHGRLLNSSN